MARTGSRQNEPVDVFRMALLPGALAGLVGGLVFAAAMTQLGVLPTIAMSVRTNSTVISVIVHVITASLIGAGFGLWCGANKRNLARHCSGGWFMACSGGF